MAPRHFSKLARRPAFRQPKRRFIVYCEGQNTEPHYFQALMGRYPGCLVELKCVGGSGVPFTVAEKAVEKLRAIRAANRRQERSSFEETDQVWAVFDRDEHPKYDEAVKLCEARGVGVARSNPCFELWLILHIEDCEQCASRHDLQNYLRKMRPEYDPNKSKTLDFAALVTSVEDAEKRAKVQLARRKQDSNPFDPPSTSVGELTSRMRMAAERFRG
ncbi:RloB family protein [Terrihabitans sp. B22-R8]|uniref:RloB family protein n=1 Tax=Terrihabitans sp. B22-R8 TaxID=3425128 RepID=UPI00403CD814